MPPDTPNPRHSWSLFGRLGSAVVLDHPTDPDGVVVAGLDPDPEAIQLVTSFGPQTSPNQSVTIHRTNARRAHAISDRWLSMYMEARPRRRSGLPGNVVKLALFHGELGAPDVLVDLPHLRNCLAGESEVVPQETLTAVGAGELRSSRLTAHRFGAGPAAAAPHA
jgi:hypothetical protein